MNPENILKLGYVSIGCLGFVIGLSNTWIGVIGGTIGFALPRFNSLPFVTDGFHTLLWQKVGTALAIGCFIGSGVREFLQFFNDSKPPGKNHSS